MWLIMYDRIVANEEGKKPKHVKCGHCGTLDPLATGLLVLVIGKEYTRRAEEFSKQDKCYEVTMKLGETSTTGDDEGDKRVVSDTVPTEKAVLRGSRAFHWPYYAGPTSVFSYENKWATCVQISEGRTDSRAKASTRHNIQ